MILQAVLDDKNKQLQELLSELRSGDMNDLRERLVRRFYTWKCL
jgi:hypothetical protein